MLSFVLLKFYYYISVCHTSLKKRDNIFSALIVFVSYQLQSLQSLKLLNIPALPNDVKQPVVGWKSEN